MLTAELRDLLNEDSAARYQARTLASIARRAENLLDSGYTAQETMNGLYVRCFVIESPERRTYRVKVSKTHAAPGTPFGSFCSCPCFDKLRTCKHLQAMTAWVDSDDRAQAQAAEYDARRDNDDDPYAEF